MRKERRKGIGRAGARRLRSFGARLAALPSSFKGTGPGLGFSADGALSCGSEPTHVPPPPAPVCGPCGGSGSVGHLDTKQT